MKKTGVEWIGVIPEDWEVRKLKYLGHYINGYAFKPEDWKSFGKRIIRIQDLTSNNENPNYYNEELDKCYEVKKGDILVSWAATLDAFIWDKETGWLNQHIFRAEPFVEIVNKRFFFWLIKESMKNMNNDNKHGIVMQHVTLGVFNNFEVPFPPKSTQQRIAAYLDKKCSKIEETIQNQQQVIEKLKAYKQSLITEAVTGKIKIQNGKVCGKYENYKDSGVEWIGKIPSGWEVGRFGRFAQVKSNLVNPNLYLEYPQIAPDNIGKGSGKLLDWQTVKDSGVISWNQLFFKGQIVYSKIRPTLNKLIIAPFDGLCSADMYPIETNIHKQFFVYMMLSQYFVEQVGLITRDRVKMPKINQNELSGILITVPTKDEQKEIADYLNKKCTTIDTAIEQKQKLIEKLTEYKKSLIYECVTGKKEVINV